VVLSHPVTGGRRDDDTSVSRSGDDEDDPDMSLHSTAALVTSPLHEDSGDGSSSEETPRSPAFRLLLLLTPKIGTGESLICGLNLVTNPVQWRKISSEDSAEMLAVGSFASVRQRDCLR
jgi:hypothetical protein